jgi:hypothetical protein
MCTDLHELFEWRIQKITWFGMFTFICLEKNPKDGIIVRLFIFNITRVCPFDGGYTNIM